MRLVEFYNPEKDRQATRNIDDTRKTKLTFCLLYTSPSPRDRG